MTALTLCLLLGMFVQLNARIMTKAELTDLYNSPVQRAEWVVRPKNGMPDNARSYFTTHSGVRVTLNDGRRFLIHKGPNYSRATDTAVTDARDMSSRWREPKKTRDFGGSRTVGDFVKAGGRRYGLIGQNCHSAAKRMMKQKKGK